MVTYGTTTIPSDQITVLAGSSVAISVAFENSIGLVGGMDTANGTATDGEVTTVRSPTDAADKFGSGSELHEQVTLAFQNGAGTIYALPVEEASTTETFGATSSGTVANVPVMDPNVHDEHEVTARDTVDSVDMTVNIVYDTPTQPTDSDTMQFNPVTGEWAADESSDYDITYDYGDWSATALEPILDESPRIIGLLTENEPTVNTLATELNSRATNFDFMHSVAGANPTVDPANYSDGVDERRVSLTFPSRAYVDAAETDEHRTVGAVAGYLASLPLGLSSTNDQIGGFTSLARTPSGYGPSDAGNLVDEEVMPLLDYPPVTIVKDMTTSTEPKFERVYAMQIVDEATELSHLISRNFVGGQNTSATRQNLRRSHENTFLGMENGSPKLLDDYTVSVEEDSSDPKQANVTIALDVVDVMDTIDATITVGDIVRNEGAE